MEIVILVASSSQEEPYEVTVSLDLNILAIHCTCAAGEWGKYCKHKTAVVLGDTTALHGGGQSQSFEKARQWIIESQLPKLFEEIAEAEKKAAAATVHAKKIKEKTAKSMNEGVAHGN